MPLALGDEIRGHESVDVGSGLFEVGVDRLGGLADLAAGPGHPGSSVAPDSVGDAGEQDLAAPFEPAVNRCVIKIEGDQGVIGGHGEFESEVVDGGWSGGLRCP